MEYRKSNFFEKALLVVGIAIIFVGFYFIQGVFGTNGVFGWEMLQAVFLWLMLIVLIVLLATEEDVKEELAMILKEHIEETKLMKEETSLLRQLNEEQLEELRLLQGKKAKK